MQSPSHVGAVQVAPVARIAMKLDELSNGVLMRSRLRGRRCGTFGDDLLCERFHFFKKFLSRVVSPALALMQSNERCQSVREKPLRLLIREARKSAEVAPIGAGRITSEAARQLLSDLGAKSAIEEYTSVI